MKSKRSKRSLTYRIPALWNCWGYDGPTKRLSGEIAIEPAPYLDACLRWIDRQSTVTGRLRGKSLSRIQDARSTGKLRIRVEGKSRRAGDWIRRDVMYGMIVRATTAWDHDGNKRLTSKRVNELGTFLKTILLLPHLHRLGVTCLYTLPVVKASRLYRKGELGCPYSAKDFFALDTDQYDDAFGESYGDIDEQFRLLVDCAHQLGMRVMLDVAPRTAARDSDWILENPEWFYWIDRRFERSYKAPHIPNVTYYNPIPGRLNEIYDVPAVRHHLAKFRFAPSVTHPQKWANFAKRMQAKPPRNLLAEISRHFGVITPPGFSDVVNDQQPPWSDVTYLRLFEDHPTEAARHIEDPISQPPYVLYDSAKASIFEGKKPMRALWQKLANIIPHYQRFGVDGARVDMAHALPNKLEQMILDKPRKRDPDFCFLAEELGTGNHAKAYRGGYNIIIGPTWWMQPRSHEGHMHNLLAELPRLKTPIMAAAETPDTPRAVSRRGGKRFAKQAVVVNCFLPNAVPMVNCGMEVFERQPLNLGLDAKPGDRFSLPKSDPLNGKLAFFDKFALHWKNAGGKQMTRLISEATALRRAFEEVLTDTKAYFAPKVTTGIRHILATGFRGKNSSRLFLMLANTDFAKPHRFRIALPTRRKGQPAVLLQVADSKHPVIRQRTLSGTLSPGEAIVLEI